MLNRCADLSTAYCFISQPISFCSHCSKAVLLEAQHAMSLKRTLCIEQGEALTHTGCLAQMHNASQKEAATVAAAGHILRVTST